MVADPSAFDPLVNPQAAIGRRSVVLKDMLAQHDITYAEYETWNRAPIPTRADIQQPQEPAAAPYFTSWLRPQILRRRVTTTLASRTTLRSTARTTAGSRSAPRST